MSDAAPRKDHPVSMRLPEADVALIDRAARLRGRSRTEFVREAAVRAAEDALLDGTVLRMSPEAFAAFEEAIAGEGRPIPELVDLLRRPAPWDAPG